MDGALRAYAFCMFMRRQGGWRDAMPVFNLHRGGVPALFLLLFLLLYRVSLAMMLAFPSTQIHGHA